MVGAGLEWVSQEDEGQMEERSAGIIDRAVHIAPVFAGSAGLFIAIFWFLGRVFADGYFGAMNIPAVQIQLSIWEYAELATLRILYLTMSFFLILTVFLILIYIVGERSREIGRKFGETRNIGRIFLALRKLTSVIWTPETDSKVRTWFATVVVVALAWAFIAILFSAYVAIIHDVGFSMGRDVVIGEGTHVRIVSEQPLFLQSSTVISQTVTTASGNLYVYPGLRLLTYNGGNYFLFQDIDPTTCAPDEVFIINRAAIVEVGLSPSASLDEVCGE